MADIDFRLKLVQRNLPADAQVHVLIRYQNDLASIEAAGFLTTSVAGDVAAGSIVVGRLDELQQHPDVLYIESSSPLKDEVDASSVAIALVDPATDRRTIPSFGSGAIIGVIDSGFDLTHPCFTDDHGGTRILAAWDQMNLVGVQGTPPAGFSYGVEYGRKAIDWALAHQCPLIVKNENSAGAHGTSVAGIAAGNGAPHNIYSRIFKGMAPEAELVLVTYRNDQPIGGSPFVIDAIAFIVGVAQARGKPVVINISQGDNLGSHDGTSCFERAIDHFVSSGRVLVVASAGNERGEPMSPESVSHHARGTVKQGETFVLPFVIQDFARLDGDIMEIWYGRGDKLSTRLRAPDGSTSNSIEAGTSSVIRFTCGPQALVSSDVNHSANGDCRIAICFQKSAGWKPGKWEVLLEGEEIQQGDFDVWVDRPNDITVLGFVENTSELSTITLPGNGQSVIAVGSFVSRPAGGKLSTEIKGSIAVGSSFGPTRDGRVKPDLIAPGTLILAPTLRKGNCAPCYVPLRGTSMAAPHVTGAIALVWAMWPSLSGAAVSQALLATCRRDEFTGTTPNTNCGHGKLDVKAFYQHFDNLGLEKGAAKMRSVFEFDLEPQKKADSERSAGMKISITIEDNNSVSITGTSEDTTYNGILQLKPQPPKTPEAIIEGGASNPIIEGGDQCWVCDENGRNCRWVKPCPFDN